MAVFIDSTSLLYYIFIFYIFRTSSRFVELRAHTHTHTHTHRPANSHVPATLHI